VHLYVLRLAVVEVEHHRAGEAVRAGGGKQVRHLGVIEGTVHRVSKYSASMGAIGGGYGKRGAQRWYAE